MSKRYNQWKMTPFSKFLYPLYINKYQILKCIINSDCLDVFVCNRNDMGLHIALLIINIILFYPIIFFWMNEIYGIDDSVPICTIGKIYH